MPAEAPSVAMSVCVRSVLLLLVLATGACGVTREVAPDDTTCDEFVSEKCCVTCKSSCCNEGDPARMCSGCGPELTCNPAAVCYNLSDPARKYAAYKDVIGTDTSDTPPGKACQETMCKVTGGIGCKNFSTPWLECGGCDHTYECHPGATGFKELKPEL